MDHPRNVVGLNLPFKFRVDRVSSFVVIVIFGFCVEVTYSRPLGELISTETSFEPLSICTSVAVWPVERIKKKTGVKKSQKCYTSCIWRESPLNWSAPKFACGVLFPAVTFLEFLNEILKGCDSTGGRNFGFLLIFEWPLLRCPWFLLCIKWKS